MVLSRCALQTLLPALVSLGTACSGVTEDRPSVFVTIASPSPVLIRGEQADLDAQVWQSTGAGDSTELKNVELAWTSDDPARATITSAGTGTARVTGVNVGAVQIRAVATSFEEAQSAAYQLRIANSLEIDSARPRTVRYGDRLTLYGVGVSDVFFASLGGGALFPDTFSVAGGTGTGQITFWVPPPASSGNIVLGGSGQFIFTADTTGVLPRDLFEPNQSTPAVIDLNATPPFASLPAVRFFNPALAFEDTDRGDEGLDWYRLTGTPSPSGTTVIFTAPTIAAAHRTYLSSPTVNGSAPAASSWTIGSGVYNCKGGVLIFEERPSDSLIVALKRLPAGGVDLISRYLAAGRYGLAVVDGYRRADPTVEADRFEENDTCDFADENFADPKLRIALDQPFADVLTIDNPHDIDWIRFQVPGGVAREVTIRTGTTDGPPGGPDLLIPTDTSDIDIYLLTVPASGGQIDSLARGRSDGSSESITLTLNPGSYYLAVVDYAGAPTSYFVCMALGTNCSFPKQGAFSQSGSTRSSPRPPRAARPAPTGSARHGITPSMLRQSGGRGGTR